MLKTTIKFLSIAIVITSCAKLHAQNPIPKLTDRSKKGILAYFKTIIKNKQIIVGQQCSETTDVAANYQKAFQRLYDSTGKYPALLGLDYGYFDKVNLSKIDHYALEHWNNGGLVTINWSADNPWVDGYNCRWNPTTKKDSINLKNLLKNAPDSKEKSNYRSELQNIANALQQLKSLQVRLLVWSFHEVNGNWFWWGVNDSKVPTNQPEFAALWKDLYETLTKDFGLDNLLWVYAPYASSAWAPPVNSMYPGDKYVDIVGTDIYPRLSIFKDYDDLKEFKKMIVNGEIGPSKESYGSFNQIDVLNTFTGKAAYFLQWDSWINAKVSIVDNLNYRQMMNDPAAITLDKIK